MGFNGIYPLVNIHFAMENHHFSWENPRLEMAMFNSKLLVYQRVIIFSVLTSTIWRPNFRATQCNPYPCNGAAFHRFCSPPPSQSQFGSWDPSLLACLQVSLHVARFFQPQWKLLRYVEMEHRSRIFSILNTSQYHSDVFAVGIS